MYLLIELINKNKTNNILNNNFYVLKIFNDFEVGLNLIRQVNFCICYKLQIITTML